MQVHIFIHKFNKMEPTWTAALPLKYSSTYFILDILYLFAFCAFLYLKFL